MKRTLSAAGLLTAAVLAFGPDVHACGDKSLSAGGIRMQRALAARYHASILMYVPQASPLREATRELKLQETLTQVGHKYREVTTWAELQASADTGHYNMILTDYADFSEVQQRVTSSSSRIVIVPVAYKLTKAETDAAGKQSRLLIRAPSRAVHYLATIAQAVRSRSTIPPRG